MSLPTIMIPATLVQCECCFAFHPAGCLTCQECNRYVSAEEYAERHQVLVEHVSVLEFA